MLLRLNEQAIETWSDISRVIQPAKPGDGVRMTFRRNGKNHTATALLTTRAEVKC